jgi:hypothetical protein
MKIDVQERLYKFVEPKLDSLKNIIIYDNGDEYCLFERYSIKKLTKDEYIVTVNGTATMLPFYKLKHAVCWCIHDKRMLIREANRIVELDLKLCSFDASYEVHKNLFTKAKKSDDKLIFLAKLNEDKLKKKAVIEELAQYISNSNNWQQRQFATKP